MRKFLLAAAATAAIAAPAAAHDNSPYVGIEGGIMLDADIKTDLSIDEDGDELFDLDDAFKVDFNYGRDFDLIVGYDFGMLRAEAELGYKRATIEKVTFSDELFDEDVIAEEDLESGRATVRSLMGNLLVDALAMEGTNVYFGGGLGRASVKLPGDRDSAWAYQLIAGIRASVTDNIDAGVKYRFFRTGKLSFHDEFVDEEFDTTYDLFSRGNFRSHSVLVSLIYNFYTPPAPLAPVIAPPPPAPVAPATQTCPDGSVILATDVCPPPPPPPPPPPAAGERG